MTLTTIDILNRFQLIRLKAEGRVNSNANTLRQWRPTDSEWYWLTTLIRTEEAMNIAGCAMFWSGVYHKEVASSRDSVVMKDWIRRVRNPNLVFSDLAINSSDDLRKLCKEGIYGPHILNQLLGGHLHFVTFAYIVLLTGAHNHWKTFQWKVQKQKIETMLEYIEISDTLLSTLAKEIRNKDEQE